MAVMATQEQGLNLMLQAFNTFFLRVAIAIIISGICYVLADNFTSFAEVLLEQIYGKIRKIGGRKGKERKGDKGEEIKEIKTTTTGVGNG